MFKRFSASSARGGRIDPSSEILLQEVTPAIQVSSVRDESDDKPYFPESTRVPFLSLLFNESSRRRHDYVVADETEASETDNPIVSIFLWEDPGLSLCWFLTLQVVFYLLVFAQYSLLTIGSVMALWQLVVDFTILKVSPSLKQLGFLRYNFDASTSIRANSFFSERLIRQTGGAVYETADLIVAVWRDICINGGLARVLVAIRIIFTVLIRSFSAPITFWITLLIFFTLPLSYSSRSLFADATRELIRIKGLMQFVSLRDFLWTASEYLGRRATHHDELYKRTGSPAAYLQCRMFTGLDRLVSAFGEYMQRFAAWMEVT